MEFNEKLQQLRKQNNLTQEQLAEKLFVSRTAISKWESGKGCPSIESLKNISKVFSVSIDELLSGEELIDLAANENRFNMQKIFGLIYAILDLMTVAFIFLPLYGKIDGTHIYSVNLLSFIDTTQINLAIYWAIFITIIVLGILQLILQRFEKELWKKFCAKCSFIMEILAICFFAAAREPYVTTFMFLILMIKVAALIKLNQIK